LEWYVLVNQLYHSLLTDGKNVDTFNNHPSMSWYWVAAVPMVSRTVQGAEYVRPLMDK
jgi:hypothetical protein